MTKKTFFVAASVLLAIIAVELVLLFLPVQVKADGPDLSTSRLIVSRQDRILSYTLYVSNTGTAAATLRFTDTLPAHLSLITGSLAYSSPALVPAAADNIITGAPATLSNTLQPGEMLSVTFRARLDTLRTTSNVVTLRDQHREYILSNTIYIYLYPLIFSNYGFPQASFEASVTSGYAPLTVVFTDTSQYASGRTWDFGDGSPLESGITATHVFTPGQYTVVLTATSDDVGSSSSGQVIESVAGWWWGIPLCPGEDKDRLGYNEEGGNDGQRKALEGLPYLSVPSQCVGWIHWAKPVWEEGKQNDADYVGYEAEVGREVKITLSRLPGDYELVGYKMCAPVIPGVIPDSCDYTGSARPGLQDESVTVGIVYNTPYLLSVHTSYQGGSFDFDPINPYLVTLEYK